MTFDLVAILVVISIGQACFVLISFGSLRSRNQTQKHLLLAIVLALIWYQLEFLFVRRTLDIDISVIYGTRYGSWTLLGPLLLLYTNYSLDDRFKFKSIHLLHFLPFFLFTIVIALATGNLLTDRSIDYGMLTVFDRRNKVPITLWQYTYGSIAFLQFFHLGLYALLGLKKIGAYSSLLKNEYSNVQDASTYWLRSFHLVVLVITGTVSAFIVFQFFTETYRRGADYFYVIPLSFSIYYLLFQAMRFPQIFFDFKSENHEERYKKSSLSPALAKSYLDKLKNTLENELLYRNRELRLSDLAEQLEISTHHLSQVINENLQQNFFDFINQYRIEEAKKRITDETNKSLLQIAFEVGFNNKTSFNNAFKRHVGMTPSAFKKTA